MILVLQARSDAPDRGGLCISQLFPFLTIRECTEYKCYILSFGASLCGARAVLVHTCHLWSGHILEMWCVGLHHGAKN